MRKYADLHIHLALKHLVDKGLEGRKNIWDRIVYNPDIHKPERAASDQYDQSDLTSLVENNVKIAVVALHPVEIVATKSWKNRLIAKIFFGFEVDRLKKWSKNGVNAFTILNRELAVITQEEGEINTKKTLQNIQKNGDFEAKIAVDREDFDNEEITKIVLSIEGAHALTDLPYNTEGEKLKQEVLKNLRFLQFERNLPIFSLTLCHFANNRMVKQSWALPLPGITKLIPIPVKRELDAPDFTFNDIGLAVLDQCLNQPKEHRILIDLKHTHVDARKEFYEKHIRNTDGSFKAPILASHCGVSGMSDFASAAAVKNVKREGKKKKYQRFNPWAINFCDEELKIIMESEGLFGVSLDQRILGAANDEYYRAVRDHLKEQYGKSKWDDFYDKDRMGRIHAAMFLDNLLYTVHKMGDEKAWSCVCIGSDFDGIIDPIDCCPTVKYFPEFEELLFKEFNHLRFRNEEDIFIPKDKTLETVLRDVFYNNINNFMKKNIHWYAMDKVELSV
ncbi:hypothetical protein MY04_5183 [Flammeovirga sp. MY04]|uniref:membrane dipeptidase n=1 Tax=Flammeovirga sp. MY04 TaxID=1191459 RepID=UPI00080633C1|nr:membrane dipeptidase [Flammeovirga sp. MY04]ANQ52515.1 hypothetical protein MY04_5183 [Flammeovirga sp. MY04]